MRTLLQWARRTEGKLTLMLIVICVAGVTAGVVSAVHVATRKTDLNDKVVRSGAVTVAALDLYRSLSRADATIISGFLEGRVESSQLRERYLKDIATANLALSTVTADAYTTENTAIVQKLANQLPMYTGLVETARTYNRQGLPLGVSYLREASGVVQNSMLPQAQRLFHAEVTQLARFQDEASDPLLITIVFWVLVVVCLVVAQVYVKRRSRRLLNAGLLAATSLALAGTVWLAVGATMSAAHGEAGRSDGTALFAPIAVAQVAGLEASAAEAMMLINHGASAASEQEFTKRITEIIRPDGLISQATAEVAQNDTRAELNVAHETARRWAIVHSELRERGSRNYMEAVELALRPVESNGSIALANKFDRVLGQAVDAAADRFTGAVQGARSALSIMDIGLAAIGVLVALCAIVGVRPRIAEYR